MVEGDVDLMRDAGLSWLAEVLGELDVERVDQLSLAKCKGPRKELLAARFWDALVFVRDYNDLVKKLRDETGALKTQLIGSQQKVIDLQDELLTNKTDQLTAFQTTVKSSVEDSIKTGICSVQSAVQTELRSSWRDVVANSSGKTSTTATDLKEAVKAAVAEEDKSKNLMIFGKCEEQNEDVAETVAEILQDMNEKPRVVECFRVGTSRIAIGNPRPIKVKLCSADAVSNILRSAKHLKNSGNNKNTFIAPDRTQEERAAHKKLVERMKEMVSDEPDKYHYIRRGAIRSVNKSVATNELSMYEY
jgi:hypothetical protein